MATIPSSLEGGLLSIRLIEARGLQPPSNADLPQSVQSAFSHGSHGVVAGSAGSCVGGARKRESVQRQQFSHLPYIVISFEKNEVIVDALGGTHSQPSYVFACSFDVSRGFGSELSLSAFLRANPSPSAHHHGHKRSQSGNDIFLATAMVQPGFDPRKITDQWYPAANGQGEFRIQIAFRPTRHEPLTIDAFELLKVVGKGSFGKVMQVRKKDTNRVYALKCSSLWILDRPTKELICCPLTPTAIRKAHIVSRSEVTHTLAERTVLAKVTSPFIVPLKFSFQSSEKLYLVLSFVNGGELFHHLQNEGKFSEERSRFYAAELLCALDHLHSFNIVYRDLKPENILLDLSGHLTLCDFGLCKLNMTENDRTNTFAGTPEYLAPELILGEGYTRVVDWWTLGVLLYEMLTGLPPFFEEDHQKMYRRIVSEQLTFPPGLVGEARRILTGLLQKDPAMRLGSRGAEEIRRHLFFHGLDWNALENRRIQPPFRPSVESAVDTSNVDSEFLSEQALDSFVEDSQLSESTQAQFEGFSYAAPTGLMGESVR